MVAIYAICLQVASVLLMMVVMNDNQGMSTSLFVTRWCASIHELLKGRQQEGWPFDANDSR